MVLRTQIIPLEANYRRIQTYTKNITIILISLEKKITASMAPSAFTEFIIHIQYSLLINSYYANDIYLLVGIERPTRLPVHRSQCRRLLVLVSFGPRQFQQRHWLRRVQPGPTCVRPVPPHGHIDQAGLPRRTVQSCDVPCRDDGWTIPPDYRR